MKARAAEFPPERVAEITGIPADDIRRLAREYATTQPSAIREGVALERSPGGGDAVRLVSCLPALVGAWRHVGGGAVEMPIWDFPFNFDFIQRPDWIRPGTRVVNELDLGRALTGELGLDPPLMSVLIHNSNPVSQQQNANTIRRGLEREDLFTVVSELFLTDTARYADIILPSTLQGEQYDLQVTWGHLYVMLNQPAIPAPGECVPNVEMFRRLAKTMGFDDDYWSLSDDELLSRMYDWSAPALQGITLEQLKEKGWMRLNVGLPHERAPHARGNFKTPSAKCEFKASAAANGNFVLPVWRNGYTEMQSGEPVDPVPTYIPPAETGANGDLAARYPLSLLSPKPHAFLNSQYANEPIQQRRQGEQRVVIHPKDAAARHIGNGDYVRVFNERGAFEGRAELSDEVMEGMAMANLGYWPSLTRGGSAVNATTSSRHCNLGGAGTQSDNRVEIARI
jgi:anaerobic selenocysteine-containing dehydrogenase